MAKKKNRKPPDPVPAPGARTEDPSLARARKARIQALADTGTIRRHMADHQVAAELEAFGTGDQG